MTCPICYENIELMYETPCRHQFCYLCLKTAYLTDNLKCPMCRGELPSNFCEEAQLKNKIDYPNVSWVYSGRKSGFWFYDKESNNEIEMAYQKYLEEASQNFCTITLFNKSYEIYFDKMIQKGPRGSRKIQRYDVSKTNLQIKGIAGLSCPN